MNKDWKGNTQSVMATLNSSSHSTSERAEFDYYATPKKAVEELLKLEKFDHIIWEPACGEGHIVNILKEQGYKVRASDIIKRGNHEVFDFLKAESWKYSIITNPPFAIATEFIKKALEIIPIGRKVAFFLRIQFLEGVKRRALFDTQPPIRIGYHLEI